MDANKVPGWLHTIDVGRVAAVSSGGYVLLREPLGCGEHCCPVWSNESRKSAGAMPPTVNLYRQIMSDAF